MQKKTLHVKSCLILNCLITITEGSDNQTLSALGETKVPKCRRTPGGDKVAHGL